jgi:hypothetical protein
MHEHHQASGKDESEQSRTSARRPPTPVDRIMALQRTVGNETVARMVAGEQPAPGPRAAGTDRQGRWQVQRAAAWTRRQDDTLTKFGDGLDDLVKEAAREIMANPQGVQAVGGYVSLWHDRIAAYFADDSATQFLATSFGYAVEQLTVAKIEAGKLADTLPAGWRVEFQLATGHTRPDIVVFDDNRTDVGWFDITSERSRGHIKNKTGSQWKTRAYVAEALYPELVLANLAPGSAGPASAAKRRGKEKAAAKRKDQWVNTLGAQMDEIYEAMTGESSGVSLTNTAQKRTFVETELGTVVGMAKLEPRTVKALFNILENGNYQRPMEVRTSGKGAAKQIPWPSAFGYGRAYLTRPDRPAAEAYVVELLDKKGSDRSASQV